MRLNSILRMIALTLVVCAFALVLGTCGGGKRDTFPRVAPTGGPPTLEEYAGQDAGSLDNLDVEFLQLDSRIAAGVGDSPEADASAFIPDLPNKNITALAPAAVYSGDLCYAVYALRQLDPEDWMALYLEWAESPGDAEVWVGLSNYHNLAWEWFLPDNWYYMVPFSNSDHYRSADGITYVAVVMLNADEILNRIWIDKCFGVGGGNIGMPWGETIGTITGRGKWPYDTEVWAKSNRGNPWPTPTYSENGHTSGYKWQCVELCERFIWRIWNIDTPPMSSISAPGNGLSYGAWKWFYQPLKEGMTRCDNGNSNIPPRIGDVIVWSAPTSSSAGHVAVVKHVDLEYSEPYIAVIQQNVYQGTWDAWYRIGLEKNGSYYHLKKPTSGVRTEILGWINYGTFTLEGEEQVETPTGFTAFSYPGMVRLEWDQKSNVDSYSLARDGVPIAYPPGDWWYYPDQVTGSGPYEYSLIAWRNGKASSPAWVTGSPIGQPPSMPTGITASQATYPNGIMISWNPVDGADSYKIYADGDTSPKFWDITGTSKFDDLANNGAPHFYQVQAVNSAGASPKSGSAYGWAGKDPIASLAGTNPTSGVAPLLVNFVASSSSDQDGLDNGITKYEWDWENDGHYDFDSDTDPTVSHTYSSPGSYVAKLRVTDNDSPAGTDTSTITITVSAGSYSVSGTVTKSGGGGLVSVKLTLIKSGFEETAYSNSLGNFTISDVPNGTYTLTPSLSGWSFSPTSQPVTVSGGNVPGKNFTAYHDPLADISTNPEPSEGDAPLEVQFDGSDSYDPDGGSIQQYAWDFTNDGSWDAYGITTSHTYSTVGNYTAKLRVKDNENDYGYDTVNVSVGSPPEEWHTYTPDDDVNSHEFTSLTVVQGYPAIAYQGKNTSSQEVLKYVRASNSNGTAWNAPVIVDTQFGRGQYPSMEIVDSNPAIAYCDHQFQDVRFVRASDTTGTEWATSVVIDGEGEVIWCYYTSLAVISGNPAATYMNGSTPNALTYVRATDSQGGAWGSPQVVTDGASNSLLMVNGRPAIAYEYGGLKFIRANDSTGSTWGSPVTIDPASCLWVSAAIINGNPAISCYSSPGGGALRYARATDAYGASWGALQTLDTAGDTGRHSSLIYYDGAPAISYLDYTNEDLKFIEATDSNGDSWSSPVTVDSAGDVGHGTSAAVVNGHPAISYKDLTNNHLKFAIYY